MREVTRDWTGPGVCLGLVLLTAMVYFRAGTYDFVNFDDPSYVFFNNAVLRGLTWKNLGWALVSGSNANWHPVTWWSHMLDISLFGTVPGRHHLVNVAFHAANGVLLFQVLRALTREQWPSALVAALFVVHPLHVESVIWIAERKDVLSMFFALLCLWAYAADAARPSRNRRALVLAAYVLGLMSKPMLVTLPVLMLLLDYWPLGRLRGRAEFLLRLRKKWPFFVLAAASSLVTIVVQRGGGAMMSVQALPPAMRLANALTAYVGYLGKLFWPFHLAPFYPIHTDEIHFRGAALCFALLAIVTALAVGARRDRPYLLVGWLWFLVSLLPVIGLIQVGAQSMADRYTYLPLTGPFIMLVWGGRDLAGAWRVPARVCAALAGVLVLLLAMRASTQTTHWRTSIDLWRHTLRVTNANVVAQNNQGDAYLRKGMYTEAIASYQETLRIVPSLPEARAGLAVALYNAGRRKEALELVQWVHASSPKDLGNLRRFAELLMEEGRLAEVLPYYQQLLDLEPARIREDSAPGRAQAESQDLRMRLGFILRRLGREAEALPWFERAHVANPRDVNAAYNLALSLVSVGRPAEAIPALEAAVALAPRNPQIRVLLARSLAGCGRKADAEVHLRRALEVEPGNAEARRALMSLPEAP